MEILNLNKEINEKDDAGDPTQYGDHDAPDHDQPVLALELTSCFAQVC
jgi:hypothetical protein